MGLAPAAEVGQVAQGLAVGWERAVHEQAPAVQAGVSQLCVVLLVEGHGAGGAPRLAPLVSQADDGERMSALTHDEEGGGRVRSAAARR